MENREKVIELAEPILAEQGLELVDVELRREGHGQMLRVLVDREGGVDLEGLSSLSRELSILLDVAEPIAGPYTLEVSSPGINRPLRKPEHFVRYIGKKVRVRSHAPLNGQRNFSGVLVTVTPGGVTLRSENGVETYVEFSNVERANYEHEYSPTDFAKRSLPRSGGRP